MKNSNVGNVNGPRSRFAARSFLMLALFLSACFVWSQSSRFSQPINEPPPQSSDTNSSSLAAGTNYPVKVVSVSGDKYFSLPFGLLSSFHLSVPDEDSSNTEVASASIAAQIPAEVKRYNGKDVVVTGFMLPLEWNDGLVSSFILLPNQMGCCFGVMPKLNDMIKVRTAGKGVKVTRDIPVSVLGTFKAGALKTDGRLTGIYQIDCERIVKPEVLNTK